MIPIDTEPDNGTSSSATLVDMFTSFMVILVDQAIARSDRPAVPLLPKAALITLFSATQGEQHGNGQHTKTRIFVFVQIQFLFN